MEKRQVVLIMVDTQRQDMLSCYSNDSAPTPNIDEIAKDGILFENAFTTQPVCGPARSTIFTGMFPHSNGMVANCMQLGANIKTAGELLNGIKCGFIGKWHLDGGDYFGYGKCPKGYNPKYWYDMRNFLDELTPEERKKSRRNMFFRSDDPNEEDTYAHRCVNRALDFIDEFKNEDFFLTVSLDEPHDPSVCPKRFVTNLSKFKFHKTPNIKASLKEKPEHHKIWAKVHKKIPFFAMRKSTKGMFACNCFCDYEVGRITASLKKFDLKPLIIYTSDHGDMFLSHGMMGKGCVMYNEITKIPFIVANGGFEKAVVKTSVSHVDILPTVLKHLGAKIPKMLQGECLQDVKLGESRDAFIEFTRYEVDHDGFMGYQPVRCIVNENYKLVINLLTSDELYDLNKDPFEKKNLINEPKLKRTREQLHDKLLQWMNETRDVYRGYYWGARPWRKNFKASYNNDGFTRQLKEEDFVQLDYSTGLPMQGSTRKKK